MSDEYHIPVLLNKVIEYLKNENLNSPVYFDGTLGGGGYTEAILETIINSKVIATDKDTIAIEYSENRLQKFGSRVKIFNSSFAEVTELVHSLGYEKISGIVLDLGLSSYQLNEEDGFSFMKQSALDMRADKRKQLTAADVINTYDENELEKIFYEYGDVYKPKSFIGNLISRTRAKPIEQTEELVKIIDDSFNIKGKARLKLIAKIFQALRIEVNSELEDLKKILNCSFDILEKGGRLVIVSYHSLEDGMVKKFIKENSSKEKISKYSKQEEVKLAKFKMLTKKPVTPDSDEIRNNSRSRSAKLRAAEKI